MVPVLNERRERETEACRMDEDERAERYAMWDARVLRFRQLLTRAAADGRMLAFFAYAAALARAMNQRAAVVDEGVCCTAQEEVPAVAAA